MKAGRLHKWTRAGVTLAATAAALAVAHAFVRAKTTRAEAANPPAGKFLTIDGLRLHYIDRGNGPAVVFLHGNGTSIQDWELSGVMALDREQFRVIAIDRPGFGYSARPGGEPWSADRQAALIARALAQLRAEAPTVVAHSWGTLVALELAGMIRLRSLVLMAGYYFPTARLDTLPASAPVMPLLGPLLRNTVLPLIGRILWPAARSRLFAPSLPTRGFMDYPTWMALRPSQLAAAGEESALMRSTAKRMAARYRTVTQPAFIVTGDGDKVVDVQQAVRLAEQMPAATLIRFPDVGHMLHHQIPLQIMQLIERAVREVPLAEDERHIPTTGPGSQIWH